MEHFVLELYVMYLLWIMFSCTVQRNCILENTRQETYAKKFESGLLCTRQLWIPGLLFSSSLKIGVNFAFVLTPVSC